MSATPAPLAEFPELSPPHLPGPDILLEARDVYRFYRSGDTETPALRGVSLTLHPGETLAVVGASGSGKSTLLALLAGLDDPDGGSVWLRSRRLSHQSPRTQARLRAAGIGMLTQSSALFEHLSVIANLALARRIRERASRGRDAAPGGADAAPAPLSDRDILERLGIAARADAWPSTLSGGETARANLALALAGSPRVLLADEPTAEVSATEEASLLALLAEIRPASSGAILVTHSDVVAASATRVLTIVDGRLRP